MTTKRSRFLVVLQYSLFISSCQLCFFLVTGFSIDLRKQLPGIWKLSISENITASSPLEAGGTKIIDNLLLAREEEIVDTGDDDDNKGSKKRSIHEQEVLLKIQQDGSFRQCDEGYEEGNWISGRWELENEESSQLESICLRLAMDRQYFGPPRDKLLTGTFSLSSSSSENETTSSQAGNNSSLSEDETNHSNTILSVSGHVEIGKFMYPKKHPSFFEEPILANPNTTGVFTLQQKLTFYQILPKKTKEKEHIYRPSDFYNRTFFMTFVPAKSIPMPRKWDSNLRRYIAPGEDQPFDIRANGIAFHANNTFTMTAPNKILRGRFEIEDRDTLYFQVSLFGAGRSMKGSVYSEGPGLSQDDRRAYKGTIVQDKDQKGRLSVSGIVTFGTDRKPPEMGKFQLMEVESLETEVMIDKPSEDDDSIFDSVFE